MKLTDSMNTYNSALWIIKEKGYSIEILDNEESDSFDWKVSKAKTEFIAADPLRLLALVSIAEEKGEKWNDYKEDLYDRILKDFYGE